MAEKMLFRTFTSVAELEAAVKQCEHVDNVKFVRQAISRGFGEDGMYIVEKTTVPRGDPSESGPPKSGPWKRCRLRLLGLGLGLGIGLGLADSPASDGPRFHGLHFDGPDFDREPYPGRRLSLITGCGHTDSTRRNVMLEILGH